MVVTQRVALGNILDATGPAASGLIPRVSRSQLFVDEYRLLPTACTRLESDTADLLVLAVGGAGTVRFLGQRHTEEVAGGDAIRVPAGASIEARAGRNGLGMVLFSAGPSCDTHAALGPDRYFASLNAEVIENATGSRSFEILFGPHSGSTRATLFVGHVPPGAAPWHFHQYDEIVWIWRGLGRFHIAAGVEELRPGAAFRIFPREPHIVENTGSDDLVVVGFFTPAGSPAAAYLADAPN